MNSTYPPQHSSPPPPLSYRDPPPSSHYSMTHVPPQGYGEPAASFPPLAPGTRPDAPDPSPKSCVENGRRYELKVIQQPKRARMCGFGDKDRRPITPPPCVRLIITDALTGKEVDCNEIDHSMFVLNVDLWSPDGSREVNLVKHSATSPSISSTTPVSYQHMSDSNSAYSSILPGQSQQRDMKNEGPGFQSGSYNPYPNGPSVNPYGQTPQHPSYQPANQYTSAYPPTNGSQPYQPPNSGYGQPQQPPYYTSGAGIHAQGHSQPSGYQPSDMASMGPGRPINNTNPVGMYTRNLIGSLSASAFRLADPGDHIGIWFVLQDLSVRTEGNFRLRFSFVNVGLPTSPAADAQTHHNQHPPTPTPQVNKGKAPVLAACFSEPFTVFSAKRFPGVVESTSLSKCFATQGIKIPIRKDGTGKGDRNGDFDDE